MFARMTILLVKPEHIESAIRLYRTSVVPEAKKQRGYRGACLLVDRPAGKGISVTFWRSERDALANEKTLFYQEQLVKFLGFFAGPPIREGYTVEVHSLAPPEKKTRPKTEPKQERRSPR